MAVALLIGLWIWDEISFDDYFKNKKTLGQVMVTQSHKGEWYTGKSIAVPIAGAIRNGYSDDISKSALTSFNNNFMISAGEKKLSGSGLFAQPDFPEMFTLKMLHGSHNGLKDPSAIMISASLAEKLFGDADPLNAVVKLNNKFDMKVAGVYEDFPFNSSFYDMKMLLPWDNNENWNRNTTEWDDHSAQLFIQLAPGANFDKTNSKIKNVPTAYIKDWHEELLLHPMEKLYLYSEFTKGKATGGRIQFVWLFGTIGVFVLLLACINFMNLSTARSEQRGKEVGIRKAVGSLRRQLIAQFLGESVLITFLAFLLSLVLVQLSLPFFNSLSGKQTTIPPGQSCILDGSPSIFFIYRPCCRQLSCFLFIRFRGNKSIERDFQSWSLCIHSQESAGSYAVYRFHYADHWHHYRIPANSTCKEPAGWLQPRWVDLGLDQYTRADKKL